MSERCVACGQFIGYVEILSGTAKFYGEPDTHFGPEINEWTCEKCLEKENRKALEERER